MNAQIRIELSQKALRQNVELYRRLAPESLFMAVIKSNAYGHGVPAVVEALRGSVDWYGVNSLEEAREVRRYDGKTPILVMGSVDRHPDLAGALKDLNGVTVVVSNVEGMEGLQVASPGTPFHLKVDTGMSRLGTRGEELEEVMRYLGERPGLPWTGMMTHFADVEDVTEQDFARKQLSLFLEAKELAQKSAAGRSLVYHAAASAAALVLPESRLDMVRVGISLYGLWPSRSTRISLLHLTGEKMDLHPVLSWKAPVVYLHRVGPGATVGYGRTFRVQRDTLVAVIPVGYNEGYSRVLSNRAFVLLHGKRARILGRVCMNMMMVDATGIAGIKPGDMAVLIGSEGEEEVSADELADLASTINYEIVTKIHPDLPRITID